MGGRITFAIVVAVAILLPAVTYGADWVPGEIIIKTEEPIDISGGPTGEPQIDLLNVQYGVYEMTRLYDDELLLDGPVSHPRGLWDWDDWRSMVETYEFVTYYVFKYSEPYSEPDVAESYENLEAVDSGSCNGFASLDFQPNDPMLPNQWNLMSVYLGCVKMHEAWDYWYLLPYNAVVIVAVIDTGMDYRYSDVTGNLVPGVDTANGDFDPTQRNDIHGTAMAATICSETNNGNAMAAFGLTDGFEVRVMPVKCYKDNGDEGDDMAKARGMLWAAKHGADVLNMSYSWREEDNDDYHLLSLKAIDGVYMLKVIMCAANGNRGTDENRYPAYHKHVMGVAGNVQDGGWWTSSTYNDRTSCAAPAKDMIAPLYFDEGIPQYEYPVSGTSYACAHISAACALIAGSYSAPFPPNYVELVRKRVEGCCDDTNGGGWDKKLGHGRINMKKVVLDIVNTTRGEERGGNAVSGLVNDKTSAEYASLPEQYTEPAVLPTYPNPAAGSVKFTFRLPESYGNEEVTIGVYDLSGRKVAEPFKDVTGPGEHSISWECLGYDGSVLAPGVYIYSVVAGDFCAVRKIVISN